MEEIIAIWQRRWDWFHRPIHAVAHILHPLWRTDKQPHDKELKAGWMQYTSRIEPDPIMQDLLETQLLRFRDRYDPDFGSARASLRDAQLKPVSWWEKYGGSCPELQRIAMRVLSQDCSSGAAERNWSLFSSIHTKKRNCLSHAQLRRLVFVNTNLRLLRKRDKQRSINEANPDTFKVEIRLEDVVHARDDEDEVWALLAAERVAHAHMTRSRTGMASIAGSEPRRARGRPRGRGRGRGRTSEAEGETEPLVEAEPEAEMELQLLEAEAEAEAEPTVSDWSVTEEDEDAFRERDTSSDGSLSLDTDST